MPEENNHSVNRTKDFKGEKNEKKKGKSVESNGYNVISKEKGNKKNGVDKSKKYGHRKKEVGNGELNCSKEIQLTFTTQLPGEEYYIANDIYTVPISFERIDLSRMVKQLLNLEDSDIAFEFLINKKLLRTSIGEFLEEYNILSENVLEVEFTKPLLKKESKKVSDVKEWMSELIIMNKTLYCSSFEGNLLYYNLHNFNNNGKIQIGNLPIHSFNCCQQKNMGIEGCFQESIFGLSNGTLQAVLQEQSKCGICIKSNVFLSNHDNIIKSIAFNPNKSVVISGGADKKVNIYDNQHVVKELKRIETESEEQKEQTGSDIETKKIKEFGSESAQMKNHTQKKKRKHTGGNDYGKKDTKIDPKKSIYIEDFASISDLHFFDNTTFLCTGLGNNIYIFDASNGSIVSLLPHNKSIICSSIINDNLFGTADEHSYINLFDRRCHGGKCAISLNSNQYFFHDKIITSLKGHKSELYFLTSSHDGYVNIYDIRLNTCPVYAIENEDKCKVLAATWFYEDVRSKAIISADEVSLKMHVF